MTHASSVKKVFVVTGNTDCPNNTYLAVCLERYLETEKYEFIDRESEAEVLVLNVCNVLAETPALIESYREVARKDPSKRVLVLGCVPGGVPRSSEHDNFHVIPWAALVRDPSLIGPEIGFAAEFSLLKADDVFSRIEPMGRLTAPVQEYCYVTIGSGCEGRCTYCSIRAGRGAARSVDPERILADAKQGAADGRSRLVLLADDAGCWGHDLGLDLAWLLGRIVEECPEARFTILDFNPANLRPMFERLRPLLPRIDHLYLPLQSGSDRILGLMDRRYRIEDVLPLLREIRDVQPNVVLETDIIVGFPGETREELLQSVEAAKSFTSASFVPFVPKLDTPASRYPDQIEPEELRTRIDLVRQSAPASVFKVIETSVTGRAHGHVGALDLVVPTARSGRVLERPAEACLARHFTVNLTEGCPLGCLFCDVESDAPPGSRSIFLYARTLESLRHELEVRSAPPELVSFSSSCEPFVASESALSVLFEVMSLLLSRGTFLLVETRADIPQKFLSLFERSASRVKVQASLPTADDRVRALLEPRGPSVQHRLQMMSELVRRGIPTEAGIGPLVPELHDSREALETLCAEIARTGVRRASVSYLDLRDVNRGRLLPLQLDGWSFSQMAGRLYTCRLEERGQAFFRPEPEWREEKFREIEAIGHDHGLELRLCRCNNLDRMTLASVDSPCNAQLTTSQGPLQVVDDRSATTCTIPTQPAPSAEESLLEFVVAGTDLGARLASPQVTTPGEQAPSPFASSDGGHGAQPDVPASETAPWRDGVAFGAGCDLSAAFRRVAGWTRKNAPSLLPDHAGAIAGMLGWVGRMKVQGRALLADDVVRLEVADSDQDSGIATVRIELHVDGAPSFWRIGAFGISYEGERLTPVATHVMRLVARYLSTVPAGAGPRSRRRPAPRGS